MWEVKPKDESSESASYSAAALAALLTKKVTTMPSRFDRALITNEIRTRMSNDVLMDTSINALIEVAFNFGYVYGIFLERNNVVYPTEPVEDADSDT